MYHNAQMVNMLTLHLKHAKNALILIVLLAKLPIKLVLNVMMDTTSILLLYYVIHVFHKFMDVLNAQARAFVQDAIHKI